MTTLLTLLLLALLASTATAWRIGTGRHTTAKVGASLLLGGILGGGLALDSDSFSSAFAARAADSTVVAKPSVFNGHYNDPNHPGCLRKITSAGKEITIVGSDDLDGSKQWKLTATEDFPGTIFVDFSPKGGPPNLLGVYDERADGIRWPDKNLWSKIKVK